MTGGFVTYLRVSTERQGQSGLGLEAQRAAVAAHVLGRGEVVAEFVEVESGKRSDRPELARALVEAKRAGAVLLIAKLDRLARNVAFIANLLESGVEVTAADMPEANRFLLHIMAAVAEQEGRAISERTRSALAAAKAEEKEAMDALRAARGVDAIEHLGAFGLPTVVEHKERAHSLCALAQHLRRVALGLNALRHLLTLELKVQHAQ